MKKELTPTTTKNKIAYKVECDFIEHGYYTDIKNDAIDKFKDFINDYGDGVRLYEGEVPEDDTDPVEWELLDYFDAEDGKKNVIDSTRPTTKGELLQDKKLVIEERNGKIFIEETGFNDGETYAVEVCQMHGNDKIDKEDAALICQAVNERQKLLDSRAELLKQVYHAIDIRCFSETENVSMTAIREELVKLGANEKELW